MFGLIIQSRPTSFLHYIKVSNRSIVVLNSFDIIFLKTNDSGQIWLDLLVNELWNTRERVVLRKCPKVTKIMPKQKGRSCHIITISNSIVICKCIPPLMNELYFDNQTVHIYIQILRLVESRILQKLLFFIQRRFHWLLIRWNIFMACLNAWGHERVQIIWHKYFKYLAK